MTLFFFFLAFFSFFCSSSSSVLVSRRGAFSRRHYGSVELVGFVLLHYRSIQQGLLWLVCIFRTRANQSIIAVCTCNRHWDRLEGIYSCGKVLKEPVRFDARSSATLSHDGWARNEISAANNVCARSPSFFHLINRGENWRCLAERTGVYMTSFLLFRATTEKRSNLSFASGERERAESREPRAPLCDCQRISKRQQSAPSLVAGCRSAGDVMGITKRGAVVSSKPHSKSYRSRRAYGAIKTRENDVEPAELRVSINNNKLLRCIL